MKYISDKQLFRLAMEHRGRELKRFYEEADIVWQVFGTLRPPDRLYAQIATWNGVVRRCCTRSQHRKGF